MCIKICVVWHEQIGCRILGHGGENMPLAVQMLLLTMLNSTLDFILKDLKVFEDLDHSGF